MHFYMLSLISLQVMQDSDCHERSWSSLGHGVIGLSNISYVSILDYLGLKATLSNYQSIVVTNGY
jgi:hypothetical protein